MVGDVGAGKTSFLNRYIDDKFTDEDNTAVPAEFVRLIRVFIPFTVVCLPVLVFVLTQCFFPLFRKRNSLSTTAKQFAFSW